MRGEDRGASLVEVLVALLVFALGASLSVRVLEIASRSLDEAELGLHATLVLGELAGARDSTRVDLAPRPVGPGRLVAEWSPGAAPVVRYEPPGRTDGSNGGGIGLPAYSRPRTWALSADL